MPKILPNENLVVTLISDTLSGEVKWKSCSLLPPNDNIEAAIKTYIILTAKIKYKALNCVYPHEYAGCYTVFIDIDNGKSGFLCYVPKGFYFYNNAERLKQVEESLLLLTLSDLEFQNLRSALLP